MGTKLLISYWTVFVVVGLGACSSKEKSPEKQVTQGSVVQAPNAPAASTSATTSPPAPVVSEPAKEVKDYEVLTFARHSSDLGEKDKKMLRDLVQSAKARGDIDNFHIAVWADRPFPAGKKMKDLPKIDRELADRRIHAIETYLRHDLDLGSFSIKTYSMAEKSNWLARAFHTKDAELKAVFSQKGAAVDIKPEQLRILKENGGSMKSVVLVSFKNLSSVSPSTLSPESSIIEPRIENSQGIQRRDSVDPVPPVERPWPYGLDNPN